MSEPQPQPIDGRPAQPTPPGWYPDPDLGSTQRYWDGSEWTGDPVPLTMAPGWYPDPHMVQTQRYWDGSRWAENVAPMTGQHQQQSAGASQLLSGVVLAGAAIGFVMSMQSANFPARS